MSSPYFRKGFKLALTETFFNLGNLLTEGIDIRAFEKLSDDEGFQKACEIFKSRLQGDNDARNKFNLKDLNIYKENLEGFVKAVGDALEYIEKRSKDKNARKARKIEGVDVLYENENCFIVSPQSPEYSHKAAYLDGGTANWCIASNDVSRAKDFWKQYKAAMVLYIYYKGEPNDSWAMVFTEENLEDISNHNVTGENRCYSQFETRKNAGHADNAYAQKSDFYEMLFKIGKTPKDFFSIVEGTAKRRFADYCAKDLLEGVIKGLENSENVVDDFRALLRIGYDVYSNERITNAIINHVGATDYIEELKKHGKDVKKLLKKMSLSIDQVTYLLSTKVWKDVAEMPELEWFFKFHEDEETRETITDYFAVENYYNNAVNLLKNRDFLVWLHEVRGYDFNRLYPYGESEGNNFLRDIQFNSPIMVMFTYQTAWQEFSVGRVEENLEIIDNLIAAGADVNAVSESGQSTLSACLETCQMWLSKQLVERGAVYEGFKPLLKEFEFMKLLTPLHFFNEGDWRDCSPAMMIGYMVEKFNIDVNQKSDKGRTAVEDALDWEIHAMLDALLSLGFKLTASVREHLKERLDENMYDERALQKTNEILEKHHLRPLK